MHLGLHHAEKKKQEGNAGWFDHLMIFVGLMAPLALIPQALKIWADRSIAGISVTSWALLAIISFMWMLYGISRHLTALIVSNLLLTTLNVLIVIGILLAQ